MQLCTKDLSGACVSQRNMREKSGTPGRWSVALDGKHPRGLNEFADIVGSNQSGILGMPWRLRPMDNKKQMSRPSSGWARRKELPEVED